MGVERPAFVWTPDKKRLLAPLDLEEPSTIYVHVDLFDLHSNPGPAFAVMAATPRHRYVLHTKNHARKLSWMAWVGTDDPGNTLASYLAIELDEDAMCSISNIVNGWSWPLGVADDGNPNDGTKPRWPLPWVEIYSMIEVVSNG